LDKSREQGARSREQGARSREQGAKGKNEIYIEESPGEGSFFLGGVTNATNFATTFAEASVVKESFGLRLT